MRLVLEITDIDYNKVNPSTINENRYEVFQKLISPMHQYLHGNQDYIDNNIVLSDGTNKHREESCIISVCTSTLQDKELLLSTIDKLKELVEREYL